MSELTRRGAFAGFAGVATATLTGTALASTRAPKSGVRGVPAEILTAARTSAAPLAQPGAVTAWAEVALCRSWDRQIYLYITDEIRGFVRVDEPAFAIAAAAQAAQRPVAVQYWGHEPEWASVGQFAGVLLAFDEHDLPGAE